MIYLSKEGMYAKIKQKMETLGTFFVLMFFAAGATVHTTATDVQAATKNGFKTEKGKSYYYQNGQKVKGWLTLNGKKLFFNKSTGVQMKRWAKDSKGKRYFIMSTVPRAIWQQAGLQTVRTIPAILIPPADI